MKRHSKLCFTIALIFILVTAVCGTAFAEDEEYTYTVRIYAGNIGVLGGGGIQVPDHASIERSENEIIITGLQYGDIVNIRAKDEADVNHEKYYVKGVRRAGRDNDEAIAEAFAVGSDRDYVIAFGIKGEMVAYTVNYVDAAGNKLLDSDTYYGMPGEREYVSYRYVEGYRPQAYNLVKTLSANESENVFNFVYAIDTGVNQNTQGDTTLNGTTTSSSTTIDGGTTVTNGGTTTTNGGTTTTNNGTNNNNNNGTNADGAQDANANAGENNAVGGDIDANTTDDNGTVQVQDLDTIGENAVPLAGPDEQQKDRGEEGTSTRFGYFPFYIIIACIAAAIFIIMLIYLRRKAKRSGENPPMTPMQ